ncbi:cell division protein FtsQ/DivIB [Clostridium cylindrosporum]|uniref:POTRA domain-containing protein n=1 Tax=Clostridium cylindrosporum DSM 605 TaxID=1121307 RepID=A0A0J8D6C8_CLOCY|nr:FtsQ-type POTRA domain-containing protein [Clostridium cylindrosporum]KMT21407.1 hypothetical protein CLCY_2c01670 [Clostridium cylindrosporum DSM 605]
MASGKSKKRAKKRKVLINLSLLLIILGIVAGVGLKSSYFLINDIKVNNNRVISKEEIEILAKLNGRNIFLLDKKAAISEIESHPYVESVKITRNFPSSVTVDVTEKKIGAVINLKEGYVNVDENGKMVQVVSKFPQGKIPILEKIPVTKYVPNGFVFDKEEQRRALKTCIQVLDNREINSVFTALDVSDPFNITFTTSNGTRINIGTESNIDYKIGLAISILNKDEVKNQKGYIKILGNGTAAFKKD